MEDNIVYNINKLMKEIQSCYKSKCYFAALSMSLILPDICSKIEYNLKDSKGYYYKEWCNEWLRDYYIVDSILSDEYKYWSNAIWEIRNVILHNAQNEYKPQDCIAFTLDDFDFYVNENLDEYDMQITGAQYTGLCRQGHRNSKKKMEIAHFINMIFYGVMQFAKKII